MFPLCLVKILCYTCRPFTNTLASSTYISAGPCLILNFNLFYSAAKVSIANSLNMCLCRVM